MTEKVFTFSLRRQNTESHVGAGRTTRGLLSARMLSTLPKAVSSVPAAVAVARTRLAKGR